jgi:hypothetical protein
MDKKPNAALPPATYANFLHVAHGQGEFFLAFGQLARGRADQAHLASTLVTSPAHAKAMLAALGEAIGRYEERFGEIPALEPAAETAPGAATPERPPQGGPAPKRAQRRR